MESLCEYLMYFPAGPVPDYRRYRGLPRRAQLYLGETVRFVLVVRRRGQGPSPGPGPGPGEGGPEAPGLDPGSWRELSASLSALASVCPGLQHRAPPPPHHHHRPLPEDPGPAAPPPAPGPAPGPGQPEDGAAPQRQAEGEELETEQEAEEEAGGFRECRPLLTHGGGLPGKEGGSAGQATVEEPIIHNDEVIFPLSVALDKLPVGTIKAKIIVTVWKRDREKAEVREHGYLTILQNRSPSQTFREDQSGFKAQVSTLLTVLPPPTVKCRQLNISGKQLTVLKVLNTSSQEELSIQDVRILPNFNASYLPMMPDGSVLLVDNVCHQSGDVCVASFCRMSGNSSRLPTKLSALEEQAFLFQLQVNERPQPDTKEGLEVPLTAIVCWSTANLPLDNKIYTHYRLPNIQLNRPKFVMMASCESPVSLYKRFTVKYTLLNNLQDFLAVRLVWTPESALSSQAGKKLSEEDLRAAETTTNSVVCHTPLNHLGYCKKGSSVTYTVAFQLSQHMKLKLQFTASVTNPPPEARPVSRRNSPSSPAVRDLMERYQANLGRSQSFSHQQPARSTQLIRTGSVMERRAITPPVGSPIGRPLYLPSEKAVLSVDKIAKRECKVLVVEPVK
ncbi:trafficking protein particle complex subunit 14 isoform X2 [Hemiscyllium ocellatum]|uniref:trafficking protein particle complex subunit 14 isoform X2 n=1 Tax=Hemiscyllium ocellatum TaxID=170820 RepID=UPI002966C19F|nr:trafficking protein particle complex subunit 14 isoform X2 [Hemiscyllium ocellatum]